MSKYVFIMFLKYVKKIVIGKQAYEAKKYLDSFNEIIYNFSYKIKQINVILSNRNSSHGRYILNLNELSEVCNRLKYNGCI